MPQQTPDSTPSAPCLCSWVTFPSTGFVESTRPGADGSRKVILALILASTSDGKRKGLPRGSPGARRAPAASLDWLSSQASLHIPPA